MDDPPLRDGHAGKNRVTRQSRGRQQSPADQEGPDEQVEQKEILDGPSKTLHPTFQERGARGQLPASDPLVQGEF